jgi:hypothetical protein
MLEIRTADELTSPELEAEWAARRAARRSPVLQHIWRTFHAVGGPIPLATLERTLASDGPEAARQHLDGLDAQDLIQLGAEGVEIAYPFSASPTPSLCASPMAASATPAAPWTPWGWPRCSGSAFPSAPAATTAGSRWPWRSNPKASPRARTGSWCGSGHGSRTSAGWSSGSERPSTSSGRKSTCERGEPSIPRYLALGPQWRRRSSSPGASSATFSTERERGRPTGHSLLVLHLTVLPRGERVSFVSRGAVRREERGGGWGRPGGGGRPDRADGRAGHHGRR